MRPAVVCVHIRSCSVIDWAVQLAAAGVLALARCGTLAAAMVFYVITLCDNKSRLKIRHNAHLSHEDIANISGAALGTVGNWRPDNWTAEELLRRLEQNRKSASAYMDAIQRLRTALGNPRSRIYDSDAERRVSQAFCKSPHFAKTRREAHISIRTIRGTTFSLSTLLYHTLLHPTFSGFLVRVE